MRYWVGLISLLVFIIITSCTADKLTVPLSIRLRCYYQEPLNQQTVVTGLKWALSYLGAELKPMQLSAAIRWENLASNQTQILELDLRQLGFSNQSLEAFERIIKHIKNSSVYKQNSSIDIGRFIMLTLNSSYHYYAITNVFSSLNQFQNAYHFEDSALAILSNGQSNISLGTRSIFQTSTTNSQLNQLAFMAIEGDSFNRSYEVFDFMPNGQPRFAIYDANGNLKTAANPNQSLAGKPAKCLWCHESNIQPNFKQPPLVDFNNAIQKKRNFLDSLRYLIVSDLDYQQLQEHSLAELLYVSFMEPNAQRLAKEWGYSLSKTQQLLQPYNTHNNAEYPSFGAVYHRSEIDHLGSIKPIKTPESAREISNYDPRF